MSRIPNLPYLVQVQKHASQPGGTLPPLERHSFANLATAVECRDRELKKPRTRMVATYMLIDETTPKANAHALEEAERQRLAHQVRVAARSAS